MSQLLALSFDQEASPRILLKGEAVRRHEDLPYGWGFGWYAAGERAAVTIKDPTSTGDDIMAQILRDWERFRSTLFVCHLRGAAKRIGQTDTQPFVRSHAGRNWLMAHSGDLDRSFASHFPGTPGGPFEPLGRTDSEHVFCWMLGQLMEMKVRALAELDPNLLHEWLLRMSELGKANVMLSDGTDLVVYRDAKARDGLHWLRRTPPHEVTDLESEDLVVDLSNSRDGSRTALLFSTCPLSGEGWTELLPGEMVIARRAQLRYTSRDSKPGAGTGVASPPMAAAPVEPRSSCVLRVMHETIYSYTEAVERSSHRFRLRPVHDARQQLLEHHLETSVDGQKRQYEDVFGNWATALEVEKPFEELVIRSTSRVRVLREDPLQLRSPLRRDAIPLVWMPWQRQMMLPYLLPSELPESELRELSDFAMSFVERNDYDLLETLLEMSATLYRDFEYVSGSTHLATTPYQVYESRRGVCQDFANLMICMSRLLSVPARYRMGYIYTGGSQASRVRSDESHAWVELYLPWVGWHGLDPTNDCQVNLDHVRVACGRNYGDATPTSGVLYKGGRGETLRTRVEVDREDG